MARLLSLYTYSIQDIHLFTSPSKHALNQSLHTQESKTSYLDVIPGCRGSPRGCGTQLIKQLVKFSPVLTESIA